MWTPSPFVLCLGETRSIIHAAPNLVGLARLIHAGTLECPFHNRLSDSFEAFYGKPQNNGTLCRFCNRCYGVYAKPLSDGLLPELQMRGAKLHCRSCLQSGPGTVESPAASQPIKQLDF